MVYHLRMPFFNALIYLNKKFAKKGNYEKMISHFFTAPFFVHAFLYSIISNSVIFLDGHTLII